MGTLVVHLDDVDQIVTVCACVPSVGHPLRSSPAAAPEGKRVRRKGGERMRGALSLSRTHAAQRVWGSVGYFSSPLNKQFYVGPVCLD